MTIITTFIADIFNENEFSGHASFSHKTTLERVDRHNVLVKQQGLCYRYETRCEYVAICWQSYTSLHIESKNLTLIELRLGYPGEISQYHGCWFPCHYDDVIMTMLASQITSLMVVYSIFYSGVNQRKHQSSASLAFVREIHRGPVNFPHKWPVTRKMFPLDDVIMLRVPPEATILATNVWICV